MAALVENLERAVPGVIAAAASSQTAGMPQDAPYAPYGIMGMMSRVSALARKEQVEAVAG